MERKITLSDEEIKLLLTGLHCIEDESHYNFYTISYMPYSEAKELKEKLRTKLLGSYQN